MWEGSYLSEPFDLRLTVLRMARNLDRIVLFTVIGTLVFGGGYYVKNVILGESPRYEKTITCKLEYTDPPVQSGDYYINEMTWNTYLDSAEFLGMIQDSMPFAAMDVTLDMWTQIGAARTLSAAVASDIHVPSVTVSTLAASKTETLCEVVQEVLTGPFAESIPEIASIRVIDVSEAELVKPDVRPVRAAVLSALLSCFFATVFLLLREIGADSIWLPATLRRRYGLSVLGTVNSEQLTENMRYLFKDRKRIAVCTADEGVDPRAVADSLRKILQDDSSGEKAGRGESAEKEWFEVPTPVLSPEAAESMRRADGVLLAVKAGLHAGKPLEYVLEYLTVQEIPVTAALLWNADEALIGSYYFLPGGRK